MRAVVQRAARAAVTVDGEVVGEIGLGVAVLLGVGQDDGQALAHWLADKVAGLRIFGDANGKLNLSVLEAGGEALVVSQFTLWGDCAKGRRPSYGRAAPPELALPLYEAFCDRLASHGLRVATGRFGAMMQVNLVNDGPVTLLLDTDKTF